MIMGVIALFVVMTAAVAAGVFSFLSWTLQRRNAQENRQDKERLRLEEQHLKLHLVWQELRVATVILQNLAPPTSEFVSSPEGLPIDELSEALATKDLLTPGTATKVRIARDDLVQMAQLAADGRAVELRRQAGFERKFLDHQRRTLTSVHDATEALVVYVRE